MKWVTMKQFLPMTVRPVHKGAYEVQLATGVERREFLEKWLGDMTGAMGWRGIQLKGSSRREREAVAAYDAARPSTHARALEAAIYLARAQVSKRRWSKAMQLYLIVHRMDPARLREVDKAWQARMAPRLVSKRPHIDRAVERFFAQRGTPSSVSAARPAVNTDFE